LVIGATQSLKEMPNIVCDKSAFPEPVVVNEEEEAEEPKYSIAGETCVVTLIDEKRTVKGNAEFSLKFYGLTFLFETREKLETFCANPKKYMAEVFHTYHHRILIIGGRLTGKKELAKRLSAFFESEIVEFATLNEETRKRVPLKEDEEKNDAEGETAQPEEPPKPEDPETKADEEEKPDGGGGEEG
jgi:YHS domain-containing protein